MTLVHDHDGLDESVWLGLERDDGLIHRIRPGARFDRHFHDSPEYWLFYEGKGKVQVDDETSYVLAGDVVCTRAGAAHDISEIYEELEGFYLEEKLWRRRAHRPPAPGLRRRRGHLVR